MVAGPSIGALLYDVGSFPCPFLVFGAVALAVSLLFHLTFPSQTAGQLFSHS